MMRTDIIDTLYNVIEKTDDAINDLLDHHCIRKHAYLCLLSKHMDNLKDAVHILEMIGEEEIYEKMRGIVGTTAMKTTELSDKPVIVKKS